MRVAIVGAGMGGLALAVALQEAGIDYQIYERAPRPTEIGAGIHVAPNGVRLLTRLGLAGRLDEIGARPVAIESRRWQDGTVLGRTPLDAEFEQRYGRPYYVVHRIALHQELLRLVQPSRLHCDRTCVAVTDHGDGAEIRFADGTAVTADLVVGADGIRSVVRRAVLRDFPVYSGYVAFRGLVRAADAPFVFPEPRLVLWLGPERHVVSYPISADFINLVAVTPVSRWTHDAWSVPGDLDRLRHAYHGWDDSVRTLLGGLTAVTEWALYDQDPADSWGTGRVTLLGDAAHALLPFVAQGANMAFEDAVVLTACLRAAPENVPGALRRYEDLRRPRTARIQGEARANAVSFHLPDSPDQVARDSSGSGENVWRDRDRIFGYDAGAAIPSARSGTHA
ncbi:FAD-dependent monooxygenase [Micromonospora sp. NPDC023814]|uniref:FAD-dependent monooxygenase n=1 Tax=Micromonospora sp. NPDC023814 TaxID=3154596 RepID=UPI0033F0167A